MSRARTLARCARCHLHMPLCVCATLPRIGSRASVVLVPHHGEWRRSSNTGRVAVLSLVRAELAVFGRREQPLDPELLLREGHHHVLLHPSADAAPLAPPPDGRPVRLLVPDGGWRQSTRIARRLAKLEGVVYARVNPPASRGLRRAPDAERAGTGVAIACALAALGEDAAAQALADAVRTMVDRSLWLRGLLDVDAVHGGIGPEARRRMAGA